MDPLVALEAAKVTASPFTVEELNREVGHDPDFLQADARMPFPELAEAAEREAQAAGLVRRLDYLHFSILFDARKKQALATVVDIDGRFWKQILRREGDVWYPDPRMSREDQPQARHFAKPDPRIDPAKNHFAFGHLVRRLDPCWDPKWDPAREPEKIPEAAQRAELQSFFLTNASPQAEELNSRSWNNLEDLILDDLRQRLKIRAIVISGPLFDEQKRLMIHGEMPVPGQYFKIVAWKSEGRVASVGWVQEQPAGVMPPISLERVPFEEPDDKKKASRLWLRPISEIAAMAKLDLSAYAAGDTYSLRKPQIGLETVFSGIGPNARTADDLLLTGALPLDDQNDASPLDRAIASMLGYREREDTEGEETAPAAAPAPMPEAIPGSRISDKAYALIVDYETGGKAYYKQNLKKRPVWPKEASGITIGFGYDLGYVGKEEFERDWAALPGPARALLAKAVGMHGKKETDAEMRAALAKVKAVVIEWDLAESVFKAATLPKFERLTTSALANTALLSGDSLGALVSLTFNRGAAYSKKPKPGQQDRWVEMRAISAATAERRFAEIPALILAMIPLWKGTAIETGMKRRRTDEAALFAAGLGAAPEGLVGMAAPAVVEPEKAAEEAAEQEALDDAEKWPDVTEEELARRADGPAIVRESAGAFWASDEDSPDYAHLARAPGVGLSFSLAAADLDLLARVNAFSLGAAGDRVLFGLRGAMIVTDHASGTGVTLTEVRPDHDTPRCVLGVWTRSAGTIAVFPGSTVPNAAAVRRWKTVRDMGNILPTGCYGYITGTHNGKPGCFLLRETISKKRKVVVRRSSDDLTYDLADVVDPCMPGDNIHPTFHSNLGGFSSVGCQTVVGVATPAGTHSGPWASFRTAAGLPKPDGTAFTYMLVTGAEGRFASELRRNGLADDPVSLAKLRRLRFGSKGPAVQRLQANLGIAAPDGDFGPITGARLHERQRALSGAGRSDGIYTPSLDDALDWSVFSAQA